jgi:hypothetical protein
VPLLPHVFEGMQKIWTLLVHPEILKLLDEIEAELSAWPDVNIGLHKFGGTQFNIKGKEIAHIHGIGLLDIRFDRAVKKETLMDDRTENHHAFPQSGWVSFYLRTKNDREYAVKLLRKKYNNIVTKSAPKIVLKQYLIIGK